MRIQLYVPVVLFFLVLSCADKKSGKDIDSIDDVVTHLIHGEELVMDLFLATPYQIEIMDSLLIIMDKVDDRVIVMYDVKNNRVVNRVIKEGQGPDEILQPISMNLSLDNKSLAIFQRQNGAYGEYNLADLVNSNISPMNKLNFKLADRIVEVNDGFLATGPYENGMFTMWDKKGTLLNTINIYPDYIQSIEDPMSRYRLSQGHIAYNKKAKTIAFAGYFTGDIAFYRLSDNNLLEIEKFSFGNNRLKKKIVRTGNINIEREDIVHCYGINSTADYFYILYSGESMGNSQHAKKNYVIKYSAKGEFVECYRTDVPLVSICISERDDKLYAVSLSESLDYVIMQFDLNKRDIDLKI